MSPESQASQAVIRELEAQRNDLAAGMALAAAHEKACSRGLQYAHAAAKAQAEVVALRAELDALKPKPEPAGG